MSTPTVSASLDKASYATGATITLTVNYSDPNTKALTVTVTVADATGSSSPVTAVAVIDPATTTVSDTGNRTWTKVSDTGSVAVFTATA